MITPSQIDLWRQSATEHQRLEFKKATRQYDWKSLCEYCVAIANEGGGHFVLGVENAPPRKVVGSEAFSDSVKTAKELFEKLGFRVDVEAVPHSSGRVVVFSIPSRPVGTAYNLSGTYLMRSGDTLVPMSEDRLRAIFAEGRPDWLEEPARSHLSGQEVVDLLDTQTFFELLRVPFPADRELALARLKSEQLVDEQSGGFVIRRLGALLLARNLRQFEDLARKAPRVVVYSGKSKTETRLDTQGQRGYAVGFRSLIKFVMAQLPQNEVVRDAIRTEVKLVPEIAVRELVANALIHQDFRVGGASVMIEVYSNRLEVSSPGEPTMDVDRLIDGYQSRNERLADLMRRIGICEEKGSGIDKVVMQAEVFQLPPPDFRVDPGRTTVAIFGLKSFDAMDRNERVRAAYQHAVLRCLMFERMTNQSLRDRFGLPESKSAIVSQVIAATIEAGRIKPDESVGTSRKLARYLPWWA